MKIFSAREGYDLVAPYYQNTKWQLLWRQVERPHVMKWLTQLAKGRGIDIGSGAGAYISDMIGLGQRVVALDLSPLMISQNKINNIQAQPDHELSYVVGDIGTDTGFADEAFDWALCARVLSNVAGLESAIKEMARIVKKGGKILITDIHPEHAYDTTGFELPEEETSKAGMAKVKIETYKHPVSRVVELLSENGFGDIHLDILKIKDVEEYIDAEKFKKLHTASRDEILYFLYVTKNVNDQHPSKY